jgi:stage II sporulation protein D
MIQAEPTLAVGVVDGYDEISGELGEGFSLEGRPIPAGPFRARTRNSEILLQLSSGEEVRCPSPAVFRSLHEGQFHLLDVTIGVNFHWERKEEQTFQGGLRIVARPGGKLCAINDIPLEAYLTSVISSEMSATAPAALLEAHAITSRSWLVAMLERSQHPKPLPPLPPPHPDEIHKWYTREDHDIFDVCADDHCQRYQGISKIISKGAQSAIERTRGQFLVHAGEVCDARFYKACGGLTEEFQNTWEAVELPYLKSVSDAPTRYQEVSEEKDAEKWIMSSPKAYCNTTDGAILKQVLPSFDQETTDFFRWEVMYRREELEAIIRKKSGFDPGDLLDIIPLERGPSGRLIRCKIVGSKATRIVGKELEIRRWLSPSHLYSSAFVVRVERGSDGVPISFTFHGAGWGHGVGLCQIGAAVMAVKGFSGSEIVRHYFPGAQLEKLY